MDPKESAERKKEGEDRQGRQRDNGNIFAFFCPIPFFNGELRQKISNG